MDAAGGHHLPRQRVGKAEHCALKVAVQQRDAVRGAVRIRRRRPAGAEEHQYSARTRQAFASGAHAQDAPDVCTRVVSIKPRLVMG